MAPDWSTSTFIVDWGNNTTSDNTWYVQGGSAAITVPPTPTAKREESPLEWLDRRVDEMRVAL